MKNRPKLSYAFKATSVKSDGTFEGLASPAGELDQGGDIVMPGAFRKTLREDFKDKDRLVPMLWQHQTYNPIGVYPVLKETDAGLEVKGACNMDVQQGRECHALMKQGSLTGLSIGYTSKRSDIDEETGIRTLIELKLWEISPVTFPMADTARVSVVKSMEGVNTLADCEILLRDAGYSRSEALAFVARVKAIATQSDSAGAGAASIQRALDILRSPA